MTTDYEREKLLKRLSLPDFEEQGDYSITSPMRMFDSDVYDPQDRDMLVLPEYRPRHGEILFYTDDSVLNDYNYTVPDDEIFNAALDKIDEIMNEQYGLNKGTWYIVVDKSS